MGKSKKSKFTKIVKLLFTNLTAKRLLLSMIEIKQNKNG